MFPGSKITRIMWFSRFGTFMFAKPIIRTQWHQKALSDALLKSPFLLAFSLLTCDVCHMVLQFVNKLAPAKGKLQRCRRVFQFWLMIPNCVGRLKPEELWPSKHMVDRKAGSRIGWVLYMFVICTVTVCQMLRPVVMVSVSRVASSCSSFGTDTLLRGPQFLICSSAVFPPRRTHRGG
jgi:hypothetical protein